MKKAFIVNFYVSTRVVVDVPEDFNIDNPSNEVWIEAATKGRKNIVSDPECYLYTDNVTELDEDYELPYDPEGLDKEEEPKHRRAMLILADGTYLEENDGRQKVFDSVKEAEEFQKQNPGSTIFII